jgi:hypothetical protein
MQDDYRRRWEQAQATKREDARKTREAIATVKRKSAEVVDPELIAELEDYAVFLYELTMLYMALAKINSTMRLFAAAYAVLTKGSFLLLEEAYTHVQR